MRRRLPEWDESAVTKVPNRQRVKAGRRDCCVKRLVLHM